ncbi:RES domain-containing protein [Burkholderia sp. 22PA0106]|uniref:RES domain-containing protein n=1 Tax=Burkholderia sp. 22PA0106 TaxID=3237371 RepID=UPI0039C26DF2
MSRPTLIDAPLPGYLTEIVPTTEAILRALDGRTYTYHPSQVFVRAIDNEKYVATASPLTPHWFGPPLELVRRDHRLPFTWLYLATDDAVAAWESQLVRNNRGAGNGFHVSPQALDHGVIARVRFARPLVLWHLGLDHCSRLGIHDIIGSPDHEACQWLGLRLRNAMLTLVADARPDGFVYPSRRVHGYPALALGDWAAPALFGRSRILMERFDGSAIHRHFLDDPMLTDGPDADAPPLIRL